MAAGTVGQYSIGAFTSPNNGDDLDASVVQGNDNTIAESYNEHDADPTIHVQSSALATRPAAGTAQRVWITTDGFRIYIDTGVAWQEVAYLVSAGGTMTGDLLFTDALFDIGKSGATRPRDGFFSRNVTVGGALTATGNATVGGTFGVTGQSTFTGTAVFVGLADFGDGLEVISGDAVIDVGRLIVGAYSGAATAGSLVTRQTSTKGTVTFGDDAAFINYGGSTVNAFTFGVSGNAAALVISSASVTTNGTDNHNSLHVLGSATVGKSFGLATSAGTDADDYSFLAQTSTGTQILQLRGDGAIGFHTSTPIAKPNVVGSKGANAALGSLCTALANYGLITDSTT